MLGFYQCDDGNNLDGDGCSSTCAVETCWDCTKDSPSVCTIPDIYSPGIINATFSDDNYFLYIYFNTSIVLLPGFDIYEAIKIDVSGPLKPYNLSWYLVNSDSYFTGIAFDEFKIALDWLDTQRLGT